MNLNNGGSASPANTSNNASINDVVGNKLDDESGDSLYALAYINERHEHSPSLVYPTLADGITVTAEGADWGTGGALVQIVPASTITSPFDIHYVNIEAVSAARTYELFLYYGAGDTFAGHIRFTKSAGLDPVLDRPFQTVLIPANSRIRARLCSGGVVADTIDMTIQYHVY